MPHLSSVSNRIRRRPASSFSGGQQIGGDSSAPSGPAGGDLAGTYPNPTFAVNMATQAELDVVGNALVAHVGDTSDAHDASAVSFIPAAGIAASTVQDAIEEDAGDLAAHLADANDAHDASAISVADAGNHFTSTEVEGALAELFAGIGGMGSTLITETTIASPISATPAGQLQATPDSPYQLVADGSTVNYHGPIYKLTKPVDGDYAWVNQGGATVATTNGGVYLAAPVGAGTSIRIRKKTQPSPPYTITVLFQPDNYPADFATVGIGFRESGTGKLEVIDIVFSSGAGGFVLATENYSGPTAFNATRSVINVRDIGLPIWLRLVHDGTTLSMQWSSSGFGFQTLASFAKNNYFTTAPDEVFFFANSDNATYSAKGHLIHWKES